MTETGFHDTIAAIATAHGAAGVAVVRVSGPDACAVAEKVAGRAPAPGTFCTAKFRDPHTGAVVDGGLVLSFAAPRSYTGEDVVEFQGHGGAVAPRRVLEAALASGARLARRGEFTQRAYLNGKLGYDEAEAVLDLVNAKTARAADAALSGMEGARRRSLRAIYDAAMEIAATVEYALDVDESDLGDDFFRRVEESLRDLRGKIESAIRREREGKLLREGALVVLAGAPNAGKSSLMNALLGEDRAIVSAVPGTTRDSIEEWLDIGGWPVRLVDTAGIRHAEDEIEAEGVRRARRLVDSADLVVALDCDIEGALKIHAKCDISPGEGLCVSSVTGEGLDALRGEIARRLDARRETAAEAAESGADDGSAVPALVEALSLLPCDASDLVLAGNALRRSAARIGSEIGAEYSEDLLERLFSRFCVGK